MTDTWSGYPDPDDPDNFWIDDVTGERVNAWTGEREPADDDVTAEENRIEDGQARWARTGRTS